MRLDIVSPIAGYDPELFRPTDSYDFFIYLFVACVVYFIGFIFWEKYGDGISNFINKHFSNK